MKNYFTKFSALLFVMLIGFGLNAQRTITGVVTDSDNNEPLIGANVLVKGTTTGTITDIDGSYSLRIPAGSDVLIFSYTGYLDQSIVLSGSDVQNVALSPGALLDEVVVVGYGSQKEKEITSAVVSVSEKEFNKGPISDAAQLLQGKVAGLQVYNRGGDPNRASNIRLRGLSTVGANVEPLVVVDGIIGASLANVDPNDIASIDVLKDGSAAAIYGSRGSSGVILVTTKKGKATQKGIQFTYNGQYGVSNKTRTIKNMTADEFLSVGGTDLGSKVDWIDEVTQTGSNMVHNLAAQGGSGKTSYRIAANLRNNDGILQKTGFDQFNTRLNLSTKAFNDKLSIDFNSGFTNRNSQFGFNEALRYAVLYNPTAPINGADSKYVFNEDQFGGYFEALGLFDAFNPVAIVNQNRNDGKKKEFNYGANFALNLLSNLTANFRVAQQFSNNNNTAYYPTTAHFRGGATSPIRKGRADLYSDESSFKLFEPYLTYVNDLGGALLTVTGGYSYQQNNFSSRFIGVNDFPDNSLDFSDKIEVSQDILNAGLVRLNTDASPDEKIIAFFGRANATINDAIFLNASVRREGSTKLGEDNKWGIFPAFGAGVDLNKFLGLEGVDNLKLRVGYGVTGSLPRLNGLSKPIRNIVNAADGGVTTELVRAANPNLKWEQKAETNIGLEYNAGRFGAVLDLYSRNISDFILEVPVDVATYGVDRQYQNAGSLSGRGVELALNYDVLKGDKNSYTTGIVLSSNSMVLEDYIVDATMAGNLGAPGQNGTNMIRIKEGDAIGQIWGPVFDGVAEDGSPKFKDVNGDGTLVVGQDKALDPSVDFEVLGKGLPTLELGWTNQLNVGGWGVNAFFRGAFGHSLVNSFRAFYEPQISTQSSYNFMNTSKKVDGLTSARFSSLYVEKADFLKLDNLTISRAIPVNTAAISNLNLSLTGQNLFVLTNYTGADPEPSLVDYGAYDNGAVVDLNNPNPLVPGIDRRENYFAARTFTLGVNFNF